MAKRVEGRSDKLLECAAEEFLEMGFREASLRVIATRADTSTGAIYTRFGDKEGLFHALTDQTVEELLSRMKEAQQGFADLSPDVQHDTVFTYGPEIWEQLVDFIYDHWDVFRLLTRCSDISCYTDMLHQIIEMEVDYTHKFLEATENDAVISGRLTPMMLHILSNAFYSGLFEIVFHDMKKEKAIPYVRQLRRFFAEGWADILGMKT